MNKWERLGDIADRVLEKLNDDRNENKNTLIDVMEKNNFTAEDYNAIFDLCAYIKCNNISIREFVKEVTGR